MTALSSIYERMRSTELNQRVGGGDPEQVGRFCYANVEQQIAPKSGDTILDFGCGIGRVLVQVAGNTDASSTVLVGMDIMPDVIEFCRTTIGGAFPNTVFELIEGANVHYDRFITASAARSRSDIVSQYGGRFTKAFAFSVFTHVDLADFAGLLGFISQMLAADAELMFTCFILTKYARYAIEHKTTTFGFDGATYERDGQVFIGNGADRLAFIAFDIALIEQLVFEAGLVISRVEYGAWRGTQFSRSLHDIVVVRRAR